MRYGDLEAHQALEAPKNIPARTRFLVLERDNYQCQLCGTGGENRLQLHHLTYRSQGGTHDPANLVTVCFVCHQQIHLGRADLVLLEVSPGDWATFPATPRRRSP